MKINRIKLMTVIAGFVLAAMLPATSNAQRPGRGNGPGLYRGDSLSEIPALTPEQRSAIKDLRTAHFRKIDLLSAEIAEKEARMNTLKLAEKADEKAIDRTIDEISKLRGDLMKEREAHHRNVKSLLTDDQKVRYDARLGKGRGEGFGPDNDRPGRQGQGRGRGQGRGNGNRQGNYGNCPYAK